MKLTIGPIRTLLTATLCAVLLSLGVPTLASASMAAGQGKGTAASSAPLDLNTASEGELTEVPGIGPALAKRIVEFRDEHGSFKRVDDLMKVRGIGEKSLEKIRPHVTVGKKK